MHEFLYLFIYWSWSFRFYVENVFTEKCGAQNNEKKKP